MLALTGLGDIMNKATPFACPTCGAEYKLVRVEAPPRPHQGHGLHKLRRTAECARRTFCAQTIEQITPACREYALANSELHRAEEWISGHPIREAAFANLKAPLPPVRAPIGPTDASEERKAAGR
jgi:hypothetical protein